MAHAAQTRGDTPPNPELPDGWEFPAGRQRRAASGRLRCCPRAPGAAGAAAPAGPQLRLMAAQRSITLDSFGGQVYLDPGMWVAATGSPLQFDVQRASYTKPVTITQIIYPA